MVARNKARSKKRIWTFKKLAKDHDVSANITEGSIESQDLRRKENEKKKKK